MATPVPARQPQGHLAGVHAPAIGHRRHIPGQMEQCLHGLRLLLEFGCCTRHCPSGESGRARYPGLRRDPVPPAASGTAGGSHSDTKVKCGFVFLHKG
jgi:hypothetical protein